MSIIIAIKISQSGWYLQTVYHSQMCVVLFCTLSEAVKLLTCETVTNSDSFSQLVFSFTQGCSLQFVNIQMYRAILRLHLIFTTHVFQLCPLEIFWKDIFSVLHQLNRLYFCPSQPFHSCKIKGLVHPKMEIAIICSPLCHSNLLDFLSFVKHTMSIQ